MLLQTGVRNVCAPLLNVEEADREQRPALGAVVLLMLLTFGRTRLDEWPLRGPQFEGLVRGCTEMPSATRSPLLFWP